MPKADWWDGQWSSVESTEAEPPGGIQGSADDTLPVPIIEITNLFFQNRLHRLYDKCDSDCANPNYQLSVWARREARLSSNLSPNWSLVTVASRLVASTCWYLTDQNIELSITCRGYEILFKGMPSCGSAIVTALLSVLNDGARRD